LSSWPENGADGLFNVLSLDYDLVILDAMLPKRDGWSVLAEMRNRGSEDACHVPDSTRCRD
jgi:two-component system copper resistance phosphate regulon response regulator CusR